MSDFSFRIEGKVCVRFLTRCEIECLSIIFSVCLLFLAETKKPSGC